MSTFLIVIICFCGVLFALGPVVLIGTSKKFMKLSKKYSATPLKSNTTGAEFVEKFLSESGAHNVKIKAVAYENDNAYSPSEETIYLSVFALSNSSVYSSAVCAHEVGHAKMHQKGMRIVGFWYAFAILDKWICKLILPLFCIGLVLSIFGGWANILGDLLLKISFLFTITSLCFRIFSIRNEENASAIAMEDLKNSGLINEHELKQAQKLLNYALGTYFVEFYERLFYNVITVKKLANKLFKRNKNKN